MKNFIKISNSKQFEPMFQYPDEIFSCVICRAYFDKKENMISHHLKHHDNVESDVLYMLVNCIKPATVQKLRNTIPKHPESAKMNRNRCRKEKF